MWAGELPDVAPSRSGPVPASTAPPDTLCGLSSSPGSSSGSSSIPPDSLPADPGSARESPSIQCDSLECPRCCRCCSAASVSVCEDSLQGPHTAGTGRGGFRASSVLSDSLESFGAQNDSLQSVPSLSESFKSSSINGDSLESLSSLSSGSVSQHSGLDLTGP